jgi:hypothetical protein
VWSHKRATTRAGVTHQRPQGAELLEWEDDPTSETGPRAKKEIWTKRIDGKRRHDRRKQILVGKVKKL